MSKRNGYDCLGTLIRAGIDYDDAKALRRISMTLHRWHEHECNGNIDRNETIGKVRWFNPDARYLDPYDPRAYHAIPDRETGALKRLKRIMAKYPDLKPYIQGDPRGAALYILQPMDVPAGKSADAYYSRGIMVY